MLDKEYFTYLVESATINSVIDLPITGYTYNPEGSLKKFFVELMVQIERWDLLTGGFFIHPKNMNILYPFFGDEIWGFKFYKTDQIFDTIILAVYSDIPLGERNVNPRGLAIGKLDYNLIERSNKLKTLW